MDTIFQDLFVLELAHNHWGRVERGLKIIEEFSHVVRFNNIRAAIKLQFRDADTFVHKDFRDRTDIRYIKKALSAKMSFDDYAELISAIKNTGCLTMSTPFDEKSVELCDNLNVDFIKIQSSDINDWVLIEEIAKTRRPVVVSTGGSSLKNIDDMVHFFKKRNIPLAINHCVSQYPTEKNRLELNQIDFLRNRYPDNVIGFSTHELNDRIEEAMFIAYAKGARTFERHIDINEDNIPVSPYCSLPEDLDRWIKAYKRAVEMCGCSGSERRLIPTDETIYLNELVRGIYAKKDLSVGHILKDEDVYLAIPLQKGQISCREFMRGERLTHDIKKDQKIGIDDIDSPYAKSSSLRQLILDRGI
ncbi:MAG: N-acetylneuraminate synthase family protein [Alphaproteobacteria bacterium]|nr:N-acetylneuraminate synthase family protein [Alphaproteobacteria bacterium]